MKPRFGLNRLEMLSGVAACSDVGHALAQGRHMAFADRHARATEQAELVVAVAEHGERLQLVDADDGATVHAQEVLRIEVALKVRGVRQVVRPANAVAVVADGYWQAEKAARLLKPVWRAGPHGKADSAAMRAEYRAAVMGEGGLMYPRAGDRPDKQDHAATAAALQGASRIIETVYEVPFLAHAAMEPLSATVGVRSGPGGGAELWLSTQSQSDTQRAVAKALGLSAALFGEITLTDGAVEQGNYDGYQVARMAHTPPLEVLVIGSGETSYGVGEEGPPSIVAALANALLAAGGKPVTRMPLAHSGWEWLASPPA